MRESDDGVREGMCEKARGDDSGELTSHTLAGPLPYSCRLLCHMLATTETRSGYTVSWTALRAMEHENEDLRHARRVRGRGTGSRPLDLELNWGPTPCTL